MECEMKLCQLRRFPQILDDHSSPVQPLDHSWYSSGKKLFDDVMDYCRWGCVNWRNKPSYQLSTSAVTISSKQKWDYRSIRRNCAAQERHSKARLRSKQTFSSLIESQNEFLYFYDISFTWIYLDNFHLICFVYNVIAFKIQTTSRKEKNQVINS